MSAGSKREREQEALDALIVSQLRGHGCDGDEVGLDELPGLTDEEKAGLKALGPNYIERLLSGETPPRPGSQDPPKGECREPAMAGGELAFGLNRAEEIDPEVAAELARRRQEIIDRVRRRRERGGGGGGA